MASFTLNEREILGDAGTPSAKDAEAFALRQFEQYRKGLDTGRPDELNKTLKQLHRGEK